MNIKKILTALWYYLSSPAYRAINRSLFFDAGYYLESYPDVAASGLDPLAHYLRTGYVENRSPGPWSYFDQNYYLHQVPVREETDIPLFHYLTVGRLKGLRPNPFVDPRYYALYNPDFKTSGLDPVTHFLKNCTKSKRCTLSPYFDPHFYCRKYPDAHGLIDNPAAAYRHFLAVGIKQERQPSAFFDPAWYADKTPVLHEQRVNAIWHYFLYGIHEKKSPSPLFDPDYYLKTGGADGEEDLLAHYLRHEPTATRRPCAWFDPVFYRERYLAGSAQASPLDHYLQQGVHQEAYPAREVAELAVNPLISVVVPVYNVVPAYLNSCIRSVLYQSYPHWQLCLADDCSTNKVIRPLLERWQAVDSRIRVAFLPENRGISGATNAAAALATGDYLAFLDNDDELAPEALFTFVKAMASRGGDLFYCDEDLIGADGTRFSIFRKPGYNAELLLCHNYVTHCVVTTRALFAKVGGCDSEMNGAQDHDLFLKLAEQAEKILHLPEILYHWRASASSTSINHSQKDYAHEAGRKSVAGALARRGVPGTVEDTELKFFYRARRQVPLGLSVTVLVAWRRPIEAFRPWLSRLVAGAGYAIGQVVVTVESAEYVETVKAGREPALEISCLVVPGDTGQAAACNLAAAKARGDFLAIVDCSLESAAEGWLAALLEYGQRDDIGIVGGRIDYPPDQPEVTPVPDCSDDRPLSYARFVANCSVLMNGLQCPQEVRSVTGEICLLRTAELRQAGGFNDEVFPRLFFVQDLAFRLGLQGRTHIYTPYCRAQLTADPIGHEPQTLASERARFQERWGELLRQGDPFYNSALLADRHISADLLTTWLTGSVTPTDEAK